MNGAFHKYFFLNKNQQYSLTLYIDFDHFRTFQFNKLQTATGKTKMESVGKSSNLPQKFNQKSTESQKPNQVRTKSINQID